MADVEIERARDEVVLVRLNRPERLNALSFPLIEQLHDTFADLDRDNGCRVIVLTGAGRGFCSGLDLKELSGSPTSAGLGGPRAGMRSQEYLAALIARLHHQRQTIVAAVNGPAFGGGMALALAADIRVAARSARFCTQFINVGLSGCDVGVSYLLPRVVGGGRSTELMMTGRQVDAAEAERIGLCTALVPDDEVLDAALAVGAQLCTSSPFGLELTKQVALTNIDAPSIEAAIHLENRTQILASTTHEMADRVAQFGRRG